MADNFETNWKKHTLQFDSRARALTVSARLLFEDEARQMPGAPLPYHPSPLGSLNYRLCALVFGSTRSLREVCEATELLWLGGRFLPASMCIRVLMELWGSVVYAQTEVLGKYQRTNDLAKAEERTQKLLTGSKVRVNWRPDAPHIESISVAAFIKAADAIAPGTLGVYEFLCDASHPSFMQHMALLFAGPSYDNWSNEKFAEEGVAVLEKTMAAAETSIRGIRDAGDAIFRQCLPLVVEEARRH